MKKTTITKLNTIKLLVDNFINKSYKLSSSEAYKLSSQENSIYNESINTIRIIHLILNEK